MSKRIPSRPVWEAARLASRAAGWGILVAAAVTLFAPAPAGAAGASSTTASSSGMLVRGGAPLPQFYLDFPRLGAPDDLARGPDGDLEISVTGSDRSVLHFLFSPRPQITTSVDRETGISRSFAGLSWNVFESAGLFGNLGLGGSITRPGIIGDDLNRKLLGPPLALHGTLELGYQFSSRTSLSLSLDHATAPDFYNDRSDFDNIRLRYGLRF